MPQLEVTLSETRPLRHTGHLSKVAIPPETTNSHGTETIGFSNNDSEMCGSIISSWTPIQP